MKIFNKTSSASLAKEIAKRTGRRESLKNDLARAEAEHARCVEVRRQALIGGEGTGEAEEAVRAARSSLEGLSDAISFLTGEIADLDRQLWVARAAEERERQAAALDRHIADIEAARRDLAKAAAAVAKAAGRLVEAIPADIHLFSPSLVDGVTPAVLARSLIVEAIRTTWPAATEPWENPYDRVTCSVMVERRLIGQEVFDGLVEGQRVPPLSEALVSLLASKAQTLRSVAPAEPAEAEAA